MVMIYYTMSSIENYFGKNQADLATMLIFNALAALLFATLAQDYMVMENPFMFSIIYVWSKFEPEQ